VKSPEINAVDSWMRARWYGEPGSSKYLAHSVEVALSRLGLAQGLPDGEEKLAHLRDHADCIETLTYAIKSRNSDFFRKIADGLDALKKENPSNTLDPRVFLAVSYYYCLIVYKDRSPTKAEVVAMTQRLWAMVRLTRCCTMIPFLTYDRDFESQIAAEIQGLPRQKWSRHFAKLGLRLKHNKPGPKTRERANTQ
jgi:hypothetical protein